jgi:hypothetical protein
VSRAPWLALALAAPLALAQAPAQDQPAAQKAQKANAAQKPLKAQPAPKARRSGDAAGRAHAKPTPEQIRRFNELQKQEQRQGATR